MPINLTDVRELMLLPEMELSDIEPHLQVAQLIVAEDLASSGLSTERKEKITLFLAAHFAVLALEVGGLTRKDVGESAESYRAVATGDRGYMMTRYGQQAMALDTTGTLTSNAQGALKAEFRVV